MIYTVNLGVQSDVVKATLAADATIGSMVRLLCLMHCEAVWLSFSVDHKGISIAEVIYIDTEKDHDFFGQFFPFPPYFVPVCRT